MASLSTEAIRSEKLSPAEVERLEKLLDEITEASGAMEPEIWFDEAVNLDSDYGGQTIPGDAFSASELKKLKKLADSIDTKEALVQALPILKPYMEGRQLYSFDVEQGWIAHLTMPGYMDQTDPSMYPTLAEAIEALHEMYGD